MGTFFVVYEFGIGRVGFVSKKMTKGSWNMWTFCAIRPLAGCQIQSEHTHELTLHQLWYLVLHILFAKGLNSMPRNLVVSRLFILIMTSFVKLIFFNAKLFMLGHLA